MDIEDRIAALAQLGEYIRSDSFVNPILMRSIEDANPWFSPYMVRNALAHWGELMREDRLRDFISGYPSVDPKTRILVLAAGNIPMVVWHDVISVLLSGAHLLIKLSHKDALLPNLCLDTLKKIAPDMPFTLIESMESPADAVIFTGGDAAKLQVQSRCTVPLLARGHRRSVAVLDEDVTDQACLSVFSDVWLYFGMGCRSVSRLFLPNTFSRERWMDLWRSYSDPLKDELLNHRIWQNRLKYQRAVNHIIDVRFQDLGFALLRQHDSDEAPIGTLNYSFYKPQDKDLIINQGRDLWQICVDGHTIPYGKSQYPDLQWFADGEDTLNFIRTYSESIVKKN